MICENISVSAEGRLLFAGQDAEALAREYGTPLYLMDEERIRHNCRLYLDAFRRRFGGASAPLYASKACSFTQLYRIIQEEGLGVDVVSAGEIYTARRAGFDLSKAYFHGNNKTDGEIRFAMENGVGCFVADCAEELRAIETAAAERGCSQRVLLRLTPGIDPHTYEAISTGKVDSKFGSAIETGQAAELTRLALSLPHIELDGFHCHVGSEVFFEDVFERAATVMLEFIAETKATLGYTPRSLDLGGGYGVRYVDSDPEVDIGAKIDSVADTLERECGRLGLEMPDIYMEPGRSIVADAGMTLYTVGSVKRIPGYKNYVSVDGGMTDDPRYALYGARYTCHIAARMNEPASLHCSLVGRCCESGDVLQPDILLPETVTRGDIAVVCTTGAYNYSMASNYNRVPRPPVVMLKGGERHVAVRRETLEDLCACDN